MLVQTVYASNSDELINLLRQNKDFDTIGLTGGFYAIDGLDVRAGGNKVSSAGADVFIKRGSGIAEERGYWKKKFNRFA